jgi:hypothetical protein
MVTIHHVLCTILRATNVVQEILSLGSGAINSLFKKTNFQIYIVEQFLVLLFTLSNNLTLKTFTTVLITLAKLLQYIYIYIYIENNP